MLLVEDRIKAAREHAKAGRHENAAMLFESILDVSPGHPQALCGLIEAKLAGADFEGAQRVVSKASGRAAQDPDFLALAAKMALLARKPEDAERLASLALSLDANHTGAALVKADVLAAAGQTAAAEELLNSVRGANATDTAVLFGLAKLYFSFGLFSPALDVAQQALRQEPEDPALNGFLGQILTFLGDHEKATPFLEKAHLDAPNNPEYLLALANNAAAIGHLSEAARLAKRTTAMFPQLMPAWLCYIKIMADRGEAITALREFAPVAKSASDRMDATLTLATAYRLAGEPAKALQLVLPLAANLGRLADMVRERILAILQDCYLSTGQIDKVAPLRAPQAAKLLKLNSAQAANPDVLQEQLARTTFVLDPGLTNLEFMVLARFIGAAGRGRETPVAGPGTLRQLVSMFGYSTYIANDDPRVEYRAEQHPLTLPVSHLFAVPEGLRGGQTGPLPYLPIPQERQVRWKAALSEFPRPWIGIAWNASATGLSLETLVPCLRALPGTLVSLVWDGSRKQLAGHKAIIDAGLHITSLADLAALVSVLDLVIAPDGMPVHAAGAAGVPGIVVNTSASPWYWCDDQGNSLWYPSIQVLRAPRPGRWAELMPEMEDTLIASARGLLGTALAEQTEEAR